jgi:hypothetical protein|tara:strand:+ start:244 stop:873 length:630 start_codon:yes stop_codon:yes gene_type:complete
MFKYKIIENFLSEVDFKNLCSIKLKKVDEKEISVYHNAIYKDGRIEAECLDDETLKRLQKNCHDKAIAILKELAPKKVSLYEYSEFHIIETGSKCSFPIHSDTANKLLSGVIYLMPESNKGTFLYESRGGKNPTEIEWKQNKALFFSREEGKSWHSYEGDKESNRIALVYNLMTTNIKGVCEVENVSYSLNRFKEFTNPYLLRFFNRVL